MITFYENALPSIDFTNPLSGYVVAAILPKIGDAGNDLTEIVSQQAYTYPDTVIHNSDGSISRTNTDNGGTISVGSVPPLNGQELLYWVELERGGNISGRLSYLFNLFSSGTDYLGLRIGAWSTGTILAKGVLNNSSANIYYNGGASKSRVIYQVIYNSVLGSITIYEQGVQVAQKLGVASDPWGLPADISLGIGSEKDKFYGCGLLKKAGSFTQAEIDSIVADPYQIFQTQVGINEEYGLKYDGSKQYANFSSSVPKLKKLDATIVISPDASQENYAKIFEISDVKMALSLAGDNTIRVNAIRGTHSTGEIVADPTTYNYTYDGTPIKIRVRVDDSAVNGFRELTLWVNDQFVGSSTGTGSNTDYYLSAIDPHTAIGGFTTELRAAFDFKGFVHSVLIAGTDINGILKNFYWTFNQKSGDTVIDHINGASATLVNFPADPNTIVTTKWQPIMPVDVRLIKADGTMDYSSISAFLTANNTVNITYHGKLYGVASDSGTFLIPNQGINTTNRINYIIEAVDNVFSGGIVGAYHTNDYQITFRQYTNVEFKNISGYKLSAGGYGVIGTNITFNHCACIADGLADYFFGAGGSNSIYTIKNSIIRGYRTQLFLSTYISNSVLDSVIISCAGYGGSGYAVQSGEIVKNTVMYDDPAISTWGLSKSIQTGAVGSNNVTDDVIDVSLGTSNQPVASYFTAPASNDYTVNTTGKAALAGQGWNGSDIVGWAYAIASALTSVTKDFITLLTLTGRVSKDHVLLASLLTSSQKAFTALFSALNTISTTKDFYILISSLQKVSTNYNVLVSTLSQVNKTHIFKASTLVKVERSYQVLVDLLESVNKTQQFNVSLFERVIKSHQELITLLSSDSLSHQFKVSANTAISKDHVLKLTTLYRDSLSQQFNMTLLQRDFVSFDILSSLYGRVSKAYGIKIDTLYRSTKNFVTLSDLLSANSVSKSFSIMISLKERMEKNFSAQMTLLENSFKNHDFLVDTLQKEVKSHAIVSNLLERVAKDYVTKIEARQTGSTDYTILLSSISRVGKIYDIVFTLQGEGVAATPSHYVLSIGGVLDFTKDGGVLNFSEGATDVISFSDVPSKVVFKT